MKLLISNTPHIRAPLSTRRIMIEVFCALIPAAVMGIIFFGGAAALVIALCLISCLASEVVYRLILKERFRDIIKKFDFTSAVTGLLLALNLPSTVPFYVPVLGGIFAVVVVKMLFGGTGKNFVNPAIAGRVFLIVSFVDCMLVKNGAFVEPLIGANFGGSVSAGQTVLSGILKNGASELSVLDLFLGTGVAGSLGETCKLALILGGVYLCFRGIISWLFPLIYIAVTGLLSCLLGGSISLFLPSIFSGGLILGAIFMATDYVTTPNTLIGNLIYFIALGVITALLRYYTGGEVVSYCILLMNFTVPLIDKFIIPKPFGYTKPPKAKKEVKA